MIVYIIVHTSIEDGNTVNCTPEVYESKERAEARLEELYERCIEIPEMVYDYYKGDSGFMVTYTERCGVDIFDLYSEEIIEGDVL